MVYGVVHVTLGFQRIDGDMWQVRCSFGRFGAWRFLCRQGFHYGSDGGYGVGAFGDSGMSGR